MEFTAREMPLSLHSFANPAIDSKQKNASAGRVSGPFLSAVPALPHPLTPPRAAGIPPARSRFVDLEHSELLRAQGPGRGAFPGRPGWGRGTSQAGRGAGARCVPGRTPAGTRFCRRGASNCDLGCEIARGAMEFQESALFFLPRPAGEAKARMRKGRRCESSVFHMLL